jgi:hypothetical protein
MGDSRGVDDVAGGAADRAAGAEGVSALASVLAMAGRLRRGCGINELIEGG